MIQFQLPSFKHFGMNFTITGKSFFFFFYLILFIQNQKWPRITNLSCKMLSVNAQKPHFILEITAASRLAVAKLECSGPGLTKKAKGANPAEKWACFPSSSSSPVLFSFLVFMPCLMKSHMLATKREVIECNFTPQVSVWIELLP